MKVKLVSQIIVCQTKLWDHEMNWIKLKAWPSKKEKKKKNLLLVVLDKMCVFCLYPIPDSQQHVKKDSCRCLILFGLLFCHYGPRAHLWWGSSLGLEPCPFLFIYSFVSNLWFIFVLAIYFVFISYLIVIYR